MPELQNPTFYFLTIWDTSERPSFHSSQAISFVNNGLHIATMFYH